MYVGTNFDLVDGLQPNNIFYANNILKRPNREDNNIGFYFSLYGNRAITQTNSTSIRLTRKVINLDNESSQITTTRELLNTTRTVDNIGANFSTLFDLWKGKEKKQTRLYYSTSFEFIHKRTRIGIEQTGNIVNDTIVVNETINPTQNIANQFPVNNYSFNEYNIGISPFGAFLLHENNKLSVRFHATVGYLANYLVQFDKTGVQTSSELMHDIYFNGRAWVTEINTGITLQAEINHSLINSNPQIVVTLSKAINFNRIGSIFSPILPKHDN